MTYHFSLRAMICSFCLCFYSNGLCLKPDFWSSGPLKSPKSLRRGAKSVTCNSGDQQIACQAGNRFWALHGGRPEVNDWHMRFSMKNYKSRSLILDPSFGRQYECVCRWRGTPRFYTHRVSGIVWAVGQQCLSLSFLKWTRRFSKAVLMSWPCRTVAYV